MEGTYCKVCGKPTVISARLDGKVYRDVKCACDCELQALKEYENGFKEREKERRRIVNGGGRVEGLYSFKMDDGKTPEATKQAHAYVNHMMECPDSGLIISGKIEQGKTFYAEAILSELQDKGRTCGVLRFSSIKNDMENDGRDVVLIDDIDKCPNEWALKRIFWLVDSFNRNDKQLIVTTNETVEELAMTENYLKKAIYSRLLEMCNIWKLETGRKRNVKGGL